MKVLEYVKKNNIDYRIILATNEIIVFMISDKQKEQIMECKDYKDISKENETKTRPEYTIIKLHNSHTRMMCDKCGYDWIYKGEMQTYATCPNCKKSVKIGKI
jgi:predicted Zn-ribbon and HTH transcriptional regulator